MEEWSWIFLFNYYIFFTFEMRSTIFQPQPFFINVDKMRNWRLQTINIGDM